MHVDELTIGRIGVTQSDDLADQCAYHVQLPKEARMPKLGSIQPSRDADHKPVLPSNIYPATTLACWRAVSVTPMKTRQTTLSGSKFHAPSSCSY